MCLRVCVSVSVWISGLLFAAVSARLIHSRHVPAPGTSASIAPAITLLPQLQGRKPEILWEDVRVDPAKTNRPGVVDGGSRPGALPSFFEGVVDSRAT